MDGGGQRGAIRRDASAPPRQARVGFADVMAASALRDSRDQAGHELKSADLPVQVAAPNFTAVTSLRAVKRSDLPVPSSGTSEAAGKKGKEGRGRAAVRFSSKPPHGRDAGGHGLERSTLPSMVYV